MSLTYKGAQYGVGKAQAVFYTRAHTHFSDEPLNVRITQMLLVQAGADFQEGPRSVAVEGRCSESGDYLEERYALIKRRGHVLLIWGRPLKVGLSSPRNNDHREYFLIKIEGGRYREP